MTRCLLVLMAVAALASACQADKMLFDFDAPTAMPPMETRAAEAALAPAPSGDGQALRITAEEGRWQSVRFPAEEPWDWTGYTGLAAEVTNPGAGEVSIYLSAENPRQEGGPRGRPPWNRASMSLAAGETATVALRFNTGEEGALWGMRGYPVIDGYPTGPAWGGLIDLSQIAAIGLGLRRAEPGDAVLVDDIRLWGGPDSPAQQIPPFVDRYGQYALQDWPGKVKRDEDLIAQREAERAQLDAAAPLPDRDEYGGWTAGPQLEATGWFRTEKVDGKWWLVTPSGHLFFSSGVDVVLPGIQTFITKRERYFQWLPERDGLFAECFGFDPRALNNADPLQGLGGETFDFQRANLIRKYGEGWPAKWRQVTYDRMRAWGFNTIAGWSDEQVYRNSPHPFAVCVWMSGEERSIEGAYGYWQQMPDVYDPSFDEEVDRVMREAGAKYGDNPLCIGYFFENEMSWGRDRSFNIAAGTLRSPADQPCRREFVRALEGKYGSLDALNAAWDTEAETWDDLRAPDEPNEACADDLQAFTYTYSLEYFRKVHAAMRRHAPHQLDLGCRFSGYNQESLRACAEVADVVSFNIYRRTVNPEGWAHTAELGKPCIIGEFHFGALDRGSLHPGLVPVKDQAERARMFAEYVHSVLDLPAFVGCHWFQYVDEPLTGRTLDGENYNIGLVTVTDTVFPELTAAARKVHEDLYPRRYYGAEKAAADPPVRKKGVGHWTGEGEDYLDPVVIDELRCGWFYNWGPARRPAEEKVTAEFVPMIWDETYVTDETLAAVKVGGYSALLGFNEPDKKGQADMSVEQAIALWPRLMETGLRLGSPATGHGAKWLDEFMEEAGRRGYRVDFICLHWYGDITAPDAVEDLRRYVTRYWERYQRPIWLTEFSGANWRSCTRLPVTFEDNARFAREAIAMLESLPFVERYAWWSTTVYPTNPHYPTTGLYWTADKITEVGAAYRDADRPANPAASH